MPFSSSSFSDHDGDEQVQSRGSAQLEDMGGEADQSKYMELQAQKRADTSQLDAGFGVGGSALMEDSEPSAADLANTSANTADLLGAPAAASSPMSPAVNSDRVSVKALFDFEGVQDGDLPFKDGDTFEASASEYELHKTDGGWVTGWHNGVEGMFPSNYVEKL